MASHLPTWEALFQYGRQSDPLFKFGVFLKPVLHSGIELGSSVFDSVHLLLISRLVWILENFGRGNVRRKVFEVLEYALDGLLKIWATY
jgi:queuine/archaeosine tRNA-ribosyltransferase